MAEEENAKSEADALRCTCPSCGDTLHYDIESKGMKCDSCGSKFNVDELPQPAAEDNTIEIMQYTCPSCGAVIHAGQTAATSFCSFCGSDVVLMQQLARIERPARIVPFSVTRERCEEIYREHLKDSRFAPDGLQSQETIGHFRPIYIPFWEYVYEAEGKSEGQGTVQYDTETDHVEETYAFVLDSEVNVSGLLYDASSMFEDETANSLDFDNWNAVPFHPAYLSGMYAEAADTDAVIYLEGVKDAAQRLFCEQASQSTDVGGHYELPQQEKIERRIVMMPVWVLANRDKERVLYTAINGDTGRIVCDPPVSRKKYAMLAGGLTAGLAVFLWLISHVIIFRPNWLLVFCGVIAVIGMRQIVRTGDEILLRRERDVDPTRRMKMENSMDKTLTLADLDPNAPIRQNWTRSGHLDLWMLLLVIVTGVAIVGISVLGWSRFIGSVISDRSLVPPIALGICVFLLFDMKYKCLEVAPDQGRRQAGKTDRFLLILMRVLLLTGVGGLLFPLPYPAYRHYIMSILIMLLLSVNMLRLNHLNNEFVTRPVPNFGGEKR